MTPEENASNNLKGDLHLAVPWYRPEQWPLLLEMSVDPSALEPTYDKWLEKAKQNLSEMKKTSIHPVKIDVDVIELSRWCKVKNRHLNDQAGFDYAAEKLRRPHEKQKFFRISFRRKWSRFTKFISHPTILIFIAAGLTSWLLPHISFIAEREKILYEKRIDLAIEITTQNLRINGKLNILQSALGLFHKDNQVTAPDQLDLKQQQKNLRKRMNILYQEVDKCVWFWHWDILWRANIPGIMSEVELDEMKKKIQGYEKNILKCTKNIEKLRLLCLSDEYNPFDSKITDLMDNMREEFFKLTQERNRLIKEIVDIFIFRKMGRNHNQKRKRQ